MYSMTQTMSPPTADLPSAIRSEIDELLGELGACISRVTRETAATASVTLPAVIARHRADFARRLNAIGEWIANYLAGRPAPGEVELARAYLVAPIRQWSSTSPVFFHILNTARDRFDSFEVTDLLLERRIGGADVTSALFDDYAQHTMYAVSFRERFNLMATKLAAETTVRTQSEDPVQILSLHSGGAHELTLAGRNAAFARAVMLTCVDADSPALRRARQRLEDQFPRRMHVVRHDPRAFVSTGPEGDPPYDIIYTINIFDQLSDRQATRLIADCYRWLKPGGALLFSNYSLHLPISERMIVSWVMNWNTRCRSEEDLRRIFTRSPFPAETVSIALDKLNVSSLITAVRTA